MNAKDKKQTSVAGGRFVMILTRLPKTFLICFVEREKMDDILTELNLETLAAVHFVKKTKRTTVGHRLALEVLEATQQAEPAMYLKLTLYWRNECVFSILGVIGRSLKV